MDLINELQSDNPSEERLLGLITDENVSYINNNGYTPLMSAFSYYGLKPNCDSNILSKMLDMNCNPQQVNDNGITALMFALIYYGKNPNCDSKILSKMLDMNCNPQQVNDNGITALMFALIYYGKNPNCDSKILSKMLDMNCVLEQVNSHGHKLLIYALQYYGTNPNYDSHIFIKLISLLHSLITRSKLIELLDTNTDDHNLKNNIMSAYLYNSRRTIINSRVSKRVLKGKRDSQSIFD